MNKVVLENLVCSKCENKGSCGPEQICCCAKAICEDPETFNQEIWNALKARKEY